MTDTRLTEFLKKAPLTREGNDKLAIAISTSRELRPVCSNGQGGYAMTGVYR